MPVYKNIVLTDVTDVHGYSSTPKRSESVFPQREDRQQHGSLLLNQLQNSLNSFREYSSSQVAAMQHKGVFVEFSGAPNCDLLTRSLESKNNGIKLLNVREEIIHNDNEEQSVVVRATVFIPDGKEEYIIKKLQAYAYDDLTSHGKPRNNDLVRSIEKITSAIRIAQFWTGRLEDLPGEELKWYELWLDTTDGTKDTDIDNLYALCDSMSIGHKDKKMTVYFPERIVVPVFANREMLLSLLKSGVLIAEIRKTAEPNVYFIEGSSLDEQTEWSNDLLNRASYNKDSPVSVCILDTGVNKNHALIMPYMQTNCLTVEDVWGTIDNDGHGTAMTGIVLYDDLRQELLSTAPYIINYSVESVKIFKKGCTTNVGLYGAVMQNAVSLSEIEAPFKKRIYCMAVTDSYSANNDGSPSSWSGTVDMLAAGGEGRLFILSSGNVDNDALKNDGYPNACLKKSVEDPAQAWNALTVGAYTKDVDINETDYTKGYRAVAGVEDLSPYSSTSNMWKKWPVKPEVVCDGGNVSTDGTNFYVGMDELSRLSLSHEISKRLFTNHFGTSAASAQCAHFAAELQAAYPDLRPETIRALIVHSARWTNAMISMFRDTDQKLGGRRKLLRACGYGIPDLKIARDTVNNRVNMIIESEIQPYIKRQGEDPRMNEMHFHTLPWPKDVLQSLSNQAVKLRITLSYFIEPGPGEKGWNNKYRYASCGLRFDIKYPNESRLEFQSRINNAMRNEDYQRNTGLDKWYLGAHNRDVGSIHSDVWEDTAVDLADCNYIAVYPVVGWWRERKNLKKYNEKLRYSLVVSIESEAEQIDLYTPIVTQIASRTMVSVPTETQKNKN